MRMQVARSALQAGDTIVGISPNRLNFAVLRGDGPGGGMTLEGIVRLLAAQSAPVIDGTYANGHDWCTLCSGEGERELDHDVDCPWRLAREYVAATS